MQINIHQLQDIMPHLAVDKCEAYLPLLNAAMEEFEINTPTREAMFLGQLSHESAELRYFEELASGSAYEGRKDLGNTQPGDGVRYKGRGPIQMTGRSNYVKVGQALGIDCVNHPEFLAQPVNGFRSAAWYWKTHGLNELADAGDYSKVTYRINGGYNGYDSRLAYWKKAKFALGLSV